MWIVCITSVRHVLTVNGYGGRQTKENEKSWCFKGWETLVSNLRCLPTMVAVAKAELKYKKRKHKLIMHLLSRKIFIT